MASIISFYEPYESVALNILHQLLHFDWTSASTDLQLVMDYDQRMRKETLKLKSLYLFQWIEIGRELRLLSQEDVGLIQRYLVQAKSEFGRGIYDLVTDGTTDVRYYNRHLPIRFPAHELYGILVQDFIARILPKDQLSVVLEQDDLTVLKAHLNNGDFPVTIQNSEGGNLLYGAAHANALQIAQYLIEDGTLNINQRDQQGYTPALIAANKGHLEMLKLLIANGANPKVRTKNNNTLLDLAFFSGQMEVVEYVRSITPEVIATPFDTRELILWVERGDEDRLIQLIKDGKLPLRYSTKKHGEVVILEVAITNDLPKLVSFIVDQYHQLEAEIGRFHMTPLYFAAAEKQLSMFKLLLSKGAQLNATMRYAYPGYVILDNLGIDFFLEMIAKGLSIHHSDDQISIGYYATYHGSKPLLEWYLQQGYSVNHCRKDGASMLSNLMVRQHMELIDLILPHCSSAIFNEQRSPVMVNAVDFGDLQLVEKLHRHGFSLEIPARVFSNYRPLHVAILRKKVDIVRYLLAQGVKASKPTSNIVFARELARQSKDRAMIDLVLKEYQVAGFLRWYFYMLLIMMGALGLFSLIMWIIFG